MERWRKTDLCIISSRAEALQAAGDAALEAQSVNMKINLVKKKIKKKGTCLSEMFNHSGIFGRT